MHSFTSNELQVFHSICQGDDTAKKISASTGLTLKPTYNLLDSLMAKGIVSIEVGTPRRYSPGGGLHASALRQFLIKKEHPIDSIVGSKLLILLSISHQDKDEKRIAEETGLKASSVRRLILQLQYYGLIDKRAKGVSISPSARSMRTFLMNFSTGSSFAIMQKKAKDGILLWNDGLQFLFSAAQLDDCSRVRATGMSAIAAYGINFFLPTEYYYYSYNDKDLKPVDIALHTILVDPTNPRATGDAMLFLKKVGIKKETFVSEAKYVGLENRARKIVAFCRGRGSKDPAFPSRADLESLFRQYGVE